MTTSEVTPRRAATRRRLVSAAVEVFAERGIEAASVEEICDRAGFTRGAFCSNFDSKGELCIEVMRWFSERNLEAIREAAPTTTAPTAHDALGVFFAASPSDPATILVMAELRLYVARHPELADDLARLYAETMPMFSKIVEQAVASRGLRLRMTPREATQLLAAVYQQESLQEVTTEGGIENLRAWIERIFDALIIES